MCTAIAKTVKEERLRWVMPIVNKQTKLVEIMKVFPFPIYVIKTDNHLTFTNRSVGYPKSADPRNPRLHPLDLYCATQGITHYYQRGSSAKWHNSA